MSRDYRTKYEKAEGPLQHRTWYRCQMYEQDHMLADYDNEDAWCGRPLQHVSNMDNELGGMWVSERTSSRCAQCNKRVREYDQQ